MNQVPQETLAQLRAYFATKPSIIMAFLFGSRAKGIARTTSDWDIAVYFQPQNLQEIEYESETRYQGEDAIAHDVERLLNREVDFVVLNRAPAHLVATVLTRGVPLEIKKRGWYIKLLLRVTTIATEWRQFAQSYYLTYQRSRSLSEEDKLLLRRAILFIESEMQDYDRFSRTTHVAYQTQRPLGRELERWVENIINASLDIAKIVLASNKLNLPETYRELILQLRATPHSFHDNTLEHLARFVKLRNVLAHEYLDIRWDHIKEFLQQGEPVMNDFLVSIKKLLEK